MPRSKKSWNSFLARLPAQFAWLEAHRYPFRIPNVSFAFTGGTATGGSQGTGGGDSGACNSGDAVVGTGWSLPAVP